MIQRLLKLSKAHNFFLFGARGTGKSTLLKNTPFLNGALYLDLLDPEIEESYALRPSLLMEQAHDLKPGSWIVIDEIQKAPKLLDVVHGLIEEKRVHFALTGSSSRKLKRKDVNLLAGRAFVFSLFPFSHRELKEKFNLQQALMWGTLPQSLDFSDLNDRARYLRTYTQTYIKEEILQEQLIRHLDPFRLFLPIAAQMNGHILNYSNIARDTGVEYKTVQSYFEILADTYIGFFLNPFHRSVRKVQFQSSKFYFFDMGVKRALERKLTLPLLPQTSDFGEAFESWFINECVRLNHYGEHDFSFSYLRTKDDVEVDLIVERPGLPLALVEIKSAEQIDERHVKSLLHFAKDFPKADLICASRVKTPQKIGRIRVLPWERALTELSF